LRLENFAGLVSPTEPIGPEGGGSTAALLIVADVPCASVFDALESGALPAVVRPCGPPAAFCDSCRVFGPPKVCVSGRGALGTSPSDGCFEIGVISARRDSSGVGILLTSLDYDSACSWLSGLVCPVPGLKPGSVRTGALSSAPIGLFKHDKERTAASVAASMR